MPPHWRFLLCVLLATANLGSSSWAQPPQPTVRVRELPDGLRAQWTLTKPEMVSASRCAAAFDSHTDHERMTLKCSVHIKLGAEGARRALRYCEEEREKKRIHAPCKIVQED